MATEKQVQAYIDAQKAKVHVDSYHDVVMSKGYIERVSGIVAGAGLGILTGMLLGVGIGLIPCLAAGASISLSAILKAVAMCGGAGLIAGSTAGGIYGGSAGAAATAAEEIERKLRQADVEKTLINDPELHRKAKQFAANPIKPAGGQTRPNTVQEAAAQSKGAFDFFRKIYDVRVGLIFGALGALAGAILGAGLGSDEILTGLPFLADAGVSLASKAIAGAGVIGIVGLTVGADYSLLFTSSVNLVKKIALGESSGRDANEPTQTEPSQMPYIPIEKPPSGKSFVMQLADEQQQTNLPTLVLNR